MTRDEEVLQAVIAERGYVVLAARCRYAVGEPVKTIYRRGGPARTDAKFYVIAETDAADLNTQLELLRSMGVDSGHLSGKEFFYFYRVNTD